MASVRGVNLDDLEARRICSELCVRLFNRLSTRTLSVAQRLSLAQELRNTYRLSFRQLSTLVKLPEDELKKYVR